jgi:hypothetical protein
MFSYTVLGGPPGNRAAPLPFATVVVCRGERVYRADSIASFAAAQVEPTLVLLQPADDVEALSARFPRTRFILPGEEMAPGAAMNLAIREAKAQRALVTWDDVVPSSHHFTSRNLERMASLDSVVLVPRLEDKEGRALPFAVEPALYKHALKIVTTTNEKEGARALAPPDYAGIYDIERFLALGGYDESLVNPWWQRMEFGFRAWMFGEGIRLFPSAHLRYSSEVAASEVVYDESYAAFYLRTLAVRFKGDSGHLPYSRLFSYLARCARPLFKGLAEFKAARAWVASRSYRYKSDAASIVDLWEEDL